MRLMTVMVMAALAPGPIAQAQAGPEAQILGYPPNVDPGRLDRARYNYVALREGRRQVAQLSLQELEDVAALDRALRGDSNDTRTTAQRCVDAELRLLDHPPSNLAGRVIDIKCREAGEPLR